MVRVLRIRDVYAVYVWPEHGVGHHRPHAHIKHRRRRIASIFFDVVETPPADVLEAIENHQEMFLERWEELNG